MRDWSQKQAIFKLSYLGNRWPDFGQIGFILLRMIYSKNWEYFVKICD